MLTGIAAQLQQAALASGWVYPGGVLLACGVYAAIVTQRRTGPWVQVTVLCMGAAFAWGLTGLRALVFVGQALNPGLEGRDVWVTGVVVDMPQYVQTGVRFRFAPEEAWMDGQPIGVPALLDLGWYSSAYNASSAIPELQRPPAEVRAGQRWGFQVRLKAPHGSVNPHGFDYELYLWEQGVQATGYVRATEGAPPPQHLAQTWQAPVAQARQWTRERIQAHVSDARTSGLLSALVVGDQRAIERDDWDVFRATGVSHLVSISGTHVTMFAWLATIVAGRLWRRSVRLSDWLPAPHAAWLLGLALAAVYALFSGWGVPAQRTTLMLAVVLALRMQGGRWPWPWVALWTAVVVLLWDPWAMLQAGFWLSFVAVAVLFMALPALGGYDQPPAPGDASGMRKLRALSWWLQAGRAMWREQWAMTVALAPLAVLWFGQVSLVGLFANALAIPWVTLVITPLALMGVLWPEVWTAASGAIALLYAVLDVLAALPWASVNLPLPPTVLGLWAVIGGVLLVLPLPWAVRAMGVVPVLACLWWRPPLPSGGEFSVLALDVGQGNAVLVQTQGHALLFDAGPRYSLESDAGHRVLLPLLKALDVRLDTVVLSHRDMDHVGGAAAVLMMQPEAGLLSSIDPQHALQQLRRSSRCEAGMHWQWDGVHFEILHPAASDYAAVPPPSPNAVSCVLRISNGRQVALLTGDIEAAQERALLQRPESADRLRADFLLVPHHGSKTSSSLAFLEAVQPRHALVQAGYRNRYGHPAAQVVERYAGLRIHLVLSPRCGASLWRSEDPQNVACLREDARRYWHHDVP